jgi:hypothetical protein
MERQYNELSISEASGVEGINLDQDTDRWRVLVNEVMNLLVA